MSRGRFASWSIILMVAVALVGCASTIKSPRLSGELTRDEAREASKEYQKLLAASASGQNSEARDLAYSILDRYPGCENEDHVLLLGARASDELGDERTARVLLDSLIQHHPESQYLPDAWWLTAQIHDRRQQWREAALAYVHYLDEPGKLPAQERARERLQSLVQEKLSLGDLGRLKDESLNTSSGEEIAFAYLQKKRDAGAKPKEMGPLLEHFLTRFPQSSHREMVAQMLSEYRSEGSYEPSGQLGVAYTDRIGLLCPLTGEYAALGQAMYNGALLALEEHNRSSEDDLKLVALDTRGDGVQAVLSARSLIDEDGVLAIVGALLSPTTIAAAVVCQSQRVALISPTATQENISSIGDEIFQTNLTRASETRLLARVTVRRLLRRRLAILYPDTDEGRNAANIFSAEAERLGARIVASEPYQSGLTDFKAPIERIRDKGPEALFVPAGPSEMRLIAPQLTFYQLEVQLLGLSTWNRPRLAEGAGDVLEGAIFPSETALMAPGESDRFQTLWKRRFHDDEVNPFALKTYFATRRLLDAIHGGARTRRAVSEELGQNLVPSDRTRTLASTESALRMLENGKVVPFPSGVFSDPIGPVLPETPAPRDREPTPRERPGGRG
jgi:branched-chain amino acid transport system substrate-binding protein